MNTSNHNSGGPVEKRASQGNNRLVQMMAVFFMLGGMQAATQFFAYRFQYQPQLGAHFNHIYAPWSIIEWADQWYFKYPDIFELSMSMGVVFSLSLIHISLRGKGSKRKKPRQNPIH